MLPEASQARKAIWEAVNPHSGKRRIDEAFPKELRSSTRENEMMIRFVNGSTWQVLGSDNFNSLVGAPPVGCVFSEWALANPSSRAYLRPIFAENNGWQMYITTPRGKNHAYKTYQAGLNDPATFAQQLSAYDTGAITPERLEKERQAYIDDYGHDQGIALFEQEYMVSFDAALLGAYYGQETRNIEQSGRLREVPYDPDFPVYTAWDLGFSDDTTIWFWQVVGKEVRILDCHSSNGKNVEFYADLVKSKPYKYALHHLPHDARAKTLASNGKSIQEQLAYYFGWDKIRIVPSLSIQDGVQAARNVLDIAWFDHKCIDGLEALKQYQREWDDARKMFRSSPRHDWTSHYADAFRMLAIAWREERPKPEDRPPVFPVGIQGATNSVKIGTTFAQLMKQNARKNRD